MQPSSASKMGGNVPVPAGISRSCVVGFAVVAVTAALVTSAVFLFVIFPPRIGTGGPQKPFVTLTAPTMENGFVTFSVGAASSAQNFTRYRPFLLVDGYPSATSLSSLMSFSVNGTTYQMNLTDVDGSGSLRAGDVFRVMSAPYGPLPAGHFWIFILEWREDGSFLNSVTWRT